MRRQAKAVNSASCNGVENASREQDERVVGPPIAGEDKKEPKQTREKADRPRTRRRLEVEGEDEGGADADASPPNAQTKDAN